MTFDLYINKGTLGPYTIGEIIGGVKGWDIVSNNKCGFSIGIYDGEVKSITVFLNSLNDEYSNFSGNVRVNNLSLLAVHELDSATCRCLFGEPAESWNDGVQESYRYFLNGYQIDFIWNLDSKRAIEYISLEES